MRKIVRWLHLSDIHFRGKHKLDQNDAFRRIRDNVQARSAAGRAPDLIFVTGDIAHSGQAGDYDGVASNLAELCEACSLSRQRVVFCPGNHDSDQAVAPVLLHGCWGKFTDVASFHEFLSSSEYGSLKQRQECYRSFVQKFRGDDGGFDAHELHAITRLELDELRVAILSINSSMLADGGPDDHGRLQVCVRSLEQRYDEIGEYDLLISLIHHPFEWLSEVEADRAERVVTSFTDITLRGHLHQSKFGRSARGGGVVCAAGALWGQSAGGYEYSHGQLSLDTLQCEVESAAYVQRTGKWMAATESHTFVRERDGSCSPELVATQLARSLKFPAQIAAALTGYSSELVMTVSGTANYFSAEKVNALSSSLKVTPPALGVLGVAGLITFYRQRRLEDILDAELPTLAAYDRVLEDASSSDPEFSSAVRSRESAALRHATTAAPQTTYAVQFLSRLVAEGNAMQIQALPDAQGGALLTQLKTALARGQDPYAAWLEVSGPPLDFTELEMLTARLAARATAPLANVALADAAKRFPLQARRLDSLARVIAAEAANPDVYSTFKKAVGL